MKYIYLIVLIVVFGACNRSESNLDKAVNLEKNDAGQTEQDKYYERIPDAPLDLYCYINSSLTSKEREEMCKHIMFDLSGNLSGDLGISIEGGKIVDIEIQSLYFDEEGLPKKDTAVIATLTRLFNGIDIQEIPTLKHIQNSDFAVRMQMERFCIGYVKVSNPRILSLVDSMRKRN